MTLKFGRLLMATTAATALALAAPQPGFAAPRAEEPAGSTFLPAGLGCAFPLLIESSAGAVRTVNFDPKDGASGQFISVRTGVVLTYTNTDTNESVSFKTSGSVTRAVVDGTTETRTATGHNGLILFPDDDPAGPTATQYNGRIVYTFNTVTGFVRVLEISAQATDICAELA